MPEANLQYYLQWLVVAALGAIISSAEIISRYRDEPDDAIRTWPSAFYMLLNATASVVALAAIRAFGWNFGISDPSAAGWVQVAVAGIGAMAVLRASLFSVTIDNETIPIGFGRFLDVLLVSVDRAVDRKRAEERGKAVSEIMKNVSFDKAYQALPAYCLSLLQNLPQADQDQLGKKIGLLFNTTGISPRVKSLLLGLALLNLVGESVLKSAVENLGKDLEMDPLPALPLTPENR
jgi:hypothetical protein